MPALVFGASETAQTWFPDAAMVRTGFTTVPTGVGALMLASAEKLAAIGADFLICPDNTIHQALPLIRAESPLPWLHIAEVAAEDPAQLVLRDPAGEVGVAGDQRVRELAAVELERGAIVAEIGLGQQRVVEPALSHLE